MPAQQHFKFALNIRYNFISSFQRTLCDNTIQKNTTENTLKNLNKENKSLFGKLLETRKERRKSIKNKFQSTGEDDISINQYLSQSKNQQVVSKSKLKSQIHPRFEIRVIKSKNATEYKEVSALAIPDFDKLTACVTDNTEVVGGAQVVPNSEDKTIERNGNFRNIDDKIISKSTAVLPSIIVKNISNYPLINRSKNVQTSYSLEMFDNSCPSIKPLHKLYPSVSKILNLTMSDHSKMLLKKWRESMILKLGEEGFMNFYRAQLNAGVQFHSAVQSFFRGTPPENLLLDGQGVDGCWKSLSSVLPCINHVQVLEGPVCHSDLLYHGVMDCVATYKGEAVLIEWKKSDKPKPTIEKTYDAPVQLSAYIGAMNFDRNYPLQVNGGLVVVAYSDGSPADTYHLSLPECIKYWNFWLHRVKAFWIQYYEGKSATINTQISS